MNSGRSFTRVAGGRANPARGLVHKAKFGGTRGCVGRRSALHSVRAYLSQAFATGRGMVSAFWTDGWRGRRMLPGRRLRGCSTFRAVDLEYRRLPPRRPLSSAAHPAGLLAGARCPLSNLPPVLNGRVVILQCPPKMWPPVPSATKKKSLVLAGAKAASRLGALGLPGIGVGGECADLIGVMGVLGVFRSVMMGLPQPPVRRRRRRGWSGPTAAAPFCSQLASLPSMRSRHRRRPVSFSMMDARTCCVHRTCPGRSSAPTRLRAPASASALYICHVKFLASHTRFRCCSGFLEAILRRRNSRHLASQILLRR